MLDDDLEKLQERISKATSTTGRQPRAKPRSAVTNVRVVAVGTPGAPYFPEKYGPSLLPRCVLPFVIFSVAELVYYRTLQWTDVRENHNKYYAIEFHKAEEVPSSFCVMVLLSFLIFHCLEWKEIFPRLHSLRPHRRSCH